MSMLEVEVDRKYKVIQNDDGSLVIKRHGEEWRDATGDNLILALAQALEAERGITKNYQEQVGRLFDELEDLRKVSEASRIIEEYIEKEGRDGNPSYPLWLDSEQQRINTEDNEDLFETAYRADIGYMWTGTFDKTIGGALVHLANELKRVKAV